MASHGVQVLGEDEWLFAKIRLYHAPVCIDVANKSTSSDIITAT